LAGFGWQDRGRKPGAGDAIHADEETLNLLSNCVIGCALTVAKVLGAGFAEKNYENALAHEARKAGLAVARQRGITVWYDGVIIGEYAVDLLIEGELIVELKALIPTRVDVDPSFRGHHTICSKLHAKPRGVGT
jgi:PD-(D/E)XK nuclease superfamily